MNQKVPLTISPLELQKWFSESSCEPLLVDVREQEELSIAALDRPVIHFPLSESESWSKNFAKHLSFEKPIVVFCHSGIRSWKFGIWLLEEDSRYQVWNLRGGIDAWSTEVDNSVKRY